MKNQFYFRRLWDQRYQSEDHLAEYDGWLDDFLRDFYPGQRLLEVAIGSGPNLCVYTRLNPADIYGCDFSETALTLASQKKSGINLFFHDISEPFEFDNAYFSVIVADLCLHYFTRRVTQRIIDELFRLLGAGGKIFLRVNMVGDFDSCFGQGDEIEENVFQNNENIKAFFSPESLCGYFKQWRKIRVEPNYTEKYGKPKQCLMAVFGKS
ncbi:MAG: class I SAM-dependent methyltransferase [Spirochaetales bacterium]|nr:class I SAM-dependent methyltransferase [Spirochaetales bacterium]